MDAENQYNTALGAKVTTAAALVTADNATRTFIKTTSKILSINLGDSYSDAWEPVGFPDNSLAVPSTQDKRLSLMAGIQGFLAENSDYEVLTNKIVFHAAKAGELRTNLMAARQAVNNADELIGEKKVTRDTAETALRQRLRATINELGELLSDMDPRWAWFGLNMPGAESTPEPVTGLVVTHGLSGELKYTYGGGVRGTRFRVWIKILTVDTDFHAVLTVNVHTATVPGLPVGKTVEAYVTAANDAGEGIASNTVSAVVT
jgi:hypothetical protein